MDHNALRIIIVIGVAFLLSAAAIGLNAMAADAARQGTVI
jgi:hypothetical protein